MIGDTHRRLREATQAPHQRLENRLDILRQVATAHGRRRLVERFHALHRDAEAALSPWLAALAGLDFDVRRRSPHLARDLAVLRGAPAQGEPITLRGVGEALGLMYVLEGSTLGGRVIRRRVEAAGGDMAGLSFLDPYGDQVGERWRSFLSLVEARPEADAIVAGAVAGFHHTERRLCGEP